MGPWDITDKRVIPHITEWIKQFAPLYVDIHVPYSGGSGSCYLINDLSQLNNIFQRTDFTSIITIFKDSFSLRGRFDEQMKRTFRTQYKEGEYWWVLREEYYPEDVPIATDGSQWSEIEAGLQEEPELIKNVLIGKEPDVPDYWLDNTDENVLILVKSYKYNFKDESWINLMVSLTNFEVLEQDVPVIWGVVISKASDYQCVIKLTRPLPFRDKTLEILEVTARDKDFPIDNIISMETEKRRGTKPIVLVNVTDLNSHIHFIAELRSTGQISFGI